MASAVRLQMAEAGAAGNAGGAELSPAAAHVLRYLRDNGSVTRQALLGSAPEQHSEYTVKNALYALLELKAVERANEGGRGVTASYRITEVGKKKIISLSQEVALSQSGYV